MRLTISPADKCIIKDGVPLNFDFTAPAEWHVVQWYGTRGIIEMRQGDPVLFSSAAIVQAYADAYDAEAARLEAEKPKPPSAAELRRAAIVSRLSAIDSAGARSLRAVVIATAKGAGAPAFDKNKLETLETEAAALRAELAGL